MQHYNMLWRIHSCKPFSRLATVEAIQSPTRHLLIALASSKPYFTVYDTTRVHTLFGKRPTSYSREMHVGCRCILLSSKPTQRYVEYHATEEIFKVLRVVSRCAGIAGRWMGMAGDITNVGVQQRLQKGVSQASTRERGLITRSAACTRILNAER